MTDLSLSPGSRAPLVAGAPRRAATRAALRPQLAAMAGQLAAGAGNLLVSLALVRVLAPGAYAEVVAFAAVFLLLHTVSGGLAAPVALDPSGARRTARRAVTGAAVLAAAVAGSAVPLAAVTGLSPVAVLLLAACVPVAPLLAVVRGGLYASGRIGGVAATLVGEPVGRAVGGLALVPSLGGTGAMLAITGASYLCLGVGLLAARRPATAGPAAAPSRPGPVLAAFVAVAVVGAIDVVVVHRVLDDVQAGTFAAVATLGSAAWFATATVPMLLLPAGRRGADAAREGFRVALAVTAAVGLAAVAVTALLPAAVWSALLGPRYALIGGDAVRYVCAMAALGVARVLVARLCLLGRSRVAVLLGALALATQLALLVTAADLGAAITATTIGCAVLLVGSSVAVAVPLRADTLLDALPAAAPAPTAGPAAAAAPAGGARVRPAAAWSWRADGSWLAGTLLVALAVRLLVTRAIWIDEAISIRQAQLGFPGMIDDLVHRDVHPPLFGAVLWAWVHLTGSVGALVVRIPGLVAGLGVVLVGHLMARDVWDRRTARITGIVLAVAPATVWYSQEVRMYVFWMLFTLLAAWAQLRILRHGRGTALQWAGFVLATAALAWTQWFAVLPVLVQHSVFLAVALRRGATPGLLRRWLLSVGASLPLIAPLVPYLAVQLGVVLGGGGTAGSGETAFPGSGSGGPDVYAVLANGIWGIWGYHTDATMVQLGALWPVLVLLALAALGRGRSTPTTVLLLVAVVPAVLLFVIGFQRRQFFEVRYFASAIPLLLVLVSRGAAGWARGPLTRVLLPGVLVASLLGGLADQQLNPDNPRVYPFDRVVAEIDTRSTPDDLTLYAPDYLRDELAYYRPDTRVALASALDPALLTGAGRPQRVFVIGSFLAKQSVSAQVGTVLAELDQQGWQVVSTTSSPTVTLWTLEPQR